MFPSRYGGVAELVRVRTELSWSVARHERYRHPEEVLSRAVDGVHAAGPLLLFWENAGATDAELRRGQSGRTLRKGRRRCAAARRLRDECAGAGADRRHGVRPLADARAG